MFKPDQSPNSEEGKPASQTTTNLNYNALQVHDQFMDSIIRKYRPTERQTLFNAANITKEGLREVGLEKIAKDLNHFSN